MTFIGFRLDGLNKVSKASKAPADPNPAEVERQISAAGPLGCSDDILASTSIYESGRTMLTSTSTLTSTVTSVSTVTSTTTQTTTVTYDV